MVQGKSGYKVSVSEALELRIESLCDEDLRTVVRFINHLETVGLGGLHGRLKKSDHVDTNQGDWLARVQLVRDYNLWHYHIGIPHYDRSKPKGQWTSQYIVHLSIIETTITLIDLDSHPPFNLPSRSLLKSL